MRRITAYIASFGALLAGVYGFAQSPRQPDRRVGPAAPPRRISLVMGNNAYPAMPLSNAVNDAREVHQTLQSLSFDSTLVTDAGLRDMNSAIDRFIAAIRPGDVAFFYYSGHGVQIDGENYLIPTTYSASDEAEVKYNAYAAALLHDRMTRAGSRLNVLILDACRNNPFRTSKSDVHGLASMTAARGSLIVFATAPGDTAADSGVFRGSLVETMKEPGLGIEQMFSRVRQKVVEASAGRQVPWTGSSLVGDFIINDPAQRSAELGARIAQEEAELKQIEERNRQRQSAQQTEDQHREQVRQEEQVQARLRQDKIEVENQQAAALRQSEIEQRMAELARQAEEQRKSDEARIAELERQHKEATAQADDLNRKTMTLEQAQAEAARLRSRIAAAEMDLNTARDAALKKLEDDYRPLRDLPSKGITKGEFETTAEFNQRKAKAEQEVAGVATRFEAEKASILQRYREVLDSRVQTDRKSLAAVVAATYQVPCKLEWRSYDADTEAVTLAISGAARSFRLARAHAINLKNGLADAGCSANFSERGAPVRVAALTFDGTSVAITASVRKINPKDGLAYVWIPAGKFRMGCSPEDWECFKDEKPAREVSIDRGFWMGETAVTQEAYQLVTGKNSSYFKGAKRPVEMITWDEAKSYCEAAGMRLPMEEEWEYAARGGTTGARFGELGQIAWYNGNSGNETHEVGQKEPNAWGLYDMLGNVWQWTYYDSNNRYVLRGASWADDPKYLRVSDRDFVEPDYQVNSLGVRCAGEL